MMRPIIALAMAGVVCGHVEAAEVFPSKPITMVVPFAAGGPADVIGRVLAERMRVSLGQPVLIENVTGAAGSVGVGKVVRAAPDGYSLILGHMSTHVLNGAVYALPYNLVDDMEPIGRGPTNPMLVVTKKSVDASTIPELVNWAKSRPSGVAAGTAGVGAGSHVAALQFGNMTGIPIHFIPYRGTGPALQDLVAGQIDMMIDQVSNSMPHLRAGNIKVFAVTAPKRLTSIPEVPTVDEAGLPGFYIEIWYGLWAPKGTPKEIVLKINSALKEAMSDAKIAQRFRELGLEIPPVEQQTPEALEAHHRAEIAKWWPIIKAANIKPE